MNQTLRIVFMGTPDFAVGILDELLKTTYQVVGIVTTPDKPSGRGQHISESAVKKYAKDLGIPILQPVRLKDESFIDELQSLHADLFVVVAFRMLPEIVWSMPPKGTINLHASLLPQYRGAAPINWAIINGEKKTGVTTFFIEKEIDTGLILAREEIDIYPEMNAGQLHDALLEIGKKLVVKSVEMISTNNFTAIPQSQITQDQLKPAPKIFKQDCKINWNRPANKVHDFIRGLSPYPTAWTLFHFETSNKDYSVKLFDAKITEQKVIDAHKIILTDHQILVPSQDFYIEIKELQLEGKRRITAHEFLVGYKNQVITVNL